MKRIARKWKGLRRALVGLARRAEEEERITSFPGMAPWDPARPGPLSSSAEPRWLGAIARKGGLGPFENQPPPARLLVDPPPVALGEELLLGQRLADLVARDPLPIPSTADREGYSDDRHFEWWCTGLRDYLWLRRALERHGGPLAPGDGVLELGCSTGRVLRHLVFQAEGLRVHGADINLRNVEWLRTFLPQRVRVFQNTTLPHLPLEDRSLALVCAYSVFTHIDELEAAWLSELHRVLRPGGFAVLTVHSEHTWRALRPGIPLHDSLLAMRDHIPDYRVTPQLFAGPLPSPRTVFWWDTAESYNCSVFHAHEYLRSAWGRFFEVCEIAVAAHSYQDVVVLRRPS